MQLDQFDRKIIAVLAEDGRLPTVELANRVGLSPSACTRRVQNLEAAGVIAGYRALIDPHAIGLGITAFVEITLERQNDDTLRAFESGLAACPNVLSCHLMSGSSDYLVQIARPRPARLRAPPRQRPRPPSRRRADRVEVRAPQSHRPAAGGDRVMFTPSRSPERRISPAQRPPG